MRLCVIPDLHTKTFVADEIIEKENDNVDQFVLLGDYFDDYYDTPEQNREVGLFINEYVNNDKFKFLIGNHDLHYIIDHPALRCRGSFEQEKFDAINEVVSADAWEKFEWTHIVDKWLFSHSGILSDGIFNQEEHDGNLNLHIQSLYEEDKTTSEILGYGGSFWNKEVRREIPFFAKSEDFIYNQMYGHTVLAKWQCTQYVGYRSYCIDESSQVYSVIDTSNDYVEVKRTSYNHRYWPGEIKWLAKNDQIKNL